MPGGQQYTPTSEVDSGIRKILNKGTKKKEIIKCVKEILLKHEGNTSEGAIYWDSNWVGGKQIHTGGGGYRQEGGKLVYADKAFYKEMADFISQEIEKAREEGRASMFKEIYREAISAGDLYKWVEKKQLEVNDILSKLNK